VRAAREPLSPRRRRAAALLSVASVAFAVASVVPIVSVPSAVAATSTGFTKTVTATRAHLETGAVENLVDSRTVTVNVDVTTGLRDPQPINITWSGAHPTGGVALDVNSAAASEQEYPVVIMQCRGLDSSTVPAAQRLSPETCWTQTPAERYVSRNEVFPPFRLDRYAAPEDRTQHPGQPDPFPAACFGNSSGTDHWVAFRAANGAVYYGGPNGCGGMAPEAVNIEGQLQPGNTTYAASDLGGNGRAKFIVNTDQSNASIGCSATQRCSLVIVPIMGISCDVVAAALPLVDQPPRRDRPIYSPVCEATGKYQPGTQLGSPDSEDVAVSGRLWWSASNWRNRITVPLTFAPDDSVCDITGGGKPSLLYGSQVARQAMQQWAPTFCTSSKLNPIRLVQTSEPQAKNLLRVRSIQAAVQAGPPDSPFESPTVQSPTAVTGFGIAFVIDHRDGTPWTSLKLDPRLLAKLLTSSYAGEGYIAIDYPVLLTNPYNIGTDPEFLALNPGTLPEQYNGVAASVLAAVSADSDVMWALTSYIQSDPEARAWLDGYPDPWGMKVNPNYRKIQLPVTSWPLLDSFVPTYLKSINPCMLENPVPWFPLAQAPVQDPNVVALNMQFGISNSQIFCRGAGTQAQRFAATGRLNPGSRILLGIVSLADAARYQLDVAQLQTTSSFDPGVKFTDATGRTFVGPTTAGLRKAVALMKPDTGLQTWTFPYNELRTTGSAAYPGTLLISTDVPTRGLPRPDAAHLATYLRYVVGPGQKPGLGNGELPPGFLPLTVPEAKSLTAYAARAADAVAAQQGFVPGVDGSGTPPTPTPTPSPTKPEPQPTPQPVPSSSEASSSPTPSASPSPSVTKIVTTPVGKTTAVPTGAGARALPLLLFVAAATGAAALGLGRWRS